jgi:lysozyme family protein
MNNFPQAIEAVLAHEGGYVNNPNDKGGETNWGIAKKYHPEIDVKNLTRDGAKQIYYNEYWEKNNLDKVVEQKVATALLDTVVNHGSGPKIIQQAINRAGVSVAIDGKLGTGSISAINKIKPDTFLSALYVEREKLYRSLVAKDPTQAQFLKGWLARISKYKGAVEGGIVALVAFGLVAYFFYKNFKKT